MGKIFINFNNYNISVFSAQYLAFKTKEHIMQNCKWYSRIKFMHLEHEHDQSMHYATSKSPFAHTRKRLQEGIATVF